MAYPHTGVTCRYPNTLALDVDDSVVLINRNAAGATNPFLAFSLINLPTDLANAIRRAVELHGEP